MPRAQRACSVRSGYPAVLEFSGPARRETRCVLGVSCVVTSELAGWSRPDVCPGYRAYGLVEEGRDSVGQGAG